MLTLNKTLYGLNDVTIVPAVMSDIESRKECDTCHKDGFLPLFTAPMSSVVDESNWNTFKDAGIHTVVPRNVPFDIRMGLSYSTFVAVGLDELKSIIDSDGNPEYKRKKRYFCVDIANGHMKKLYDMCGKAKEIYGDCISLMTGNIANPETYFHIADNYPGVIDYIRCGIGGGSACTTSANGGLHYPMASLLSEIRYTRNIGDISGIYPKIVADGGFSNFDQIIKALALGADYVMLGNIFARCDEACGKTHIDYDIEKYPNSLVYEFGKNDDYDDCDVLQYVKFREYYGMSTKKAQREFGGNGNKTAEGIVKYVPVEYTLAGWVDNFKSYLKSVMSYTGFRKIEDFICGPRLAVMTNSAYTTYFK
jgi:hypothetical protein